MSYDNELTGALFRNDRKREGKKDADYRGSVTVAGVEYWVDSWLNESKGGAKYLSLKLRRKDAVAKASPTKPESERVPADFDDDLPF